MIGYRQITMDDPRYQQERELRNRILLRPIGIADFGWETRDPSSLHFIAEEGVRVIACVVLWPNPETSKSAQLTQMAVTDELQGKGVGKGLVNYLIAVATKNGIREITCHARANVVGFYEKLGFEVYGEPFVEAGIAHRHMKKLV